MICIVSDIGYPIRYRKGGLLVDVKGKPCGLLECKA
jgi:hypothetical protein